MRVHITDLQPGDRLAQDIFTRFGLLVLSEGAVLDGNALSRLYQLEIDYVEIESRSTEIGKRQIENDYVNTRLLPTYQNALAGMEQMFDHALETGKIYEEDLEKSLQPLVENCREEKDVVSLLLLLNSQDDYTYQHSIQVGLLSYYIAQWMGWSEENAVQARTAGFLHDIGKCKVPNAILHKPDKLTDEEYQEIKKHTEYGYEIIQNSFHDPILANAALQHHERMDGTGYPHGITGENIHPVSRIVAVADTYSAMISTRVYAEKRDLLAVLKELYRGSFSELDPEVTHTFIRHMLPNFIGKKVELTGGIQGTIVMNHPTDFFRPLVRTGKTFIDLSKESELDIVRVYL